MPDPTPRTTGTPTYQASRSRRRCTGEPSLGCGRSCAPQAAVARGVALQPLALHVVIELFRPQQAGKALPHYVLRVIRQLGRYHRVVKLACLKLAGEKDLIEFAIERVFCGGQVLVREAELNRNGFAGCHRETVVRCSLGAFALSIYGVDPAVHYEIIDAVLAEDRTRSVVQASVVGLVPGEQHLRFVLEIQVASAVDRIIDVNHRARPPVRSFGEPWLGRVWLP